MSKPPKIDRKELRHPDEFQKKGTVFVELLASNKNHLLLLAVGIVVILLGSYGYNVWDDHRIEKAWNAYYKAGKAGEKEKWEEYKKVFTEHKGTRAALFASTTVADHYFEEAKKSVLKDVNANPPETATAIEWYNHALEYNGLLPQEKQLITINKGNAVELSKNYDEAMKLYQGAADGGGNVKGYALLNVARVLELKNDKAKAMETYEKVSTDFLNTEYAKMAKNSLRRMKNTSLSNLNL